MKLIGHNYGKARMRAMKVLRDGATHTIKEIEGQVMLQGDFESSYTQDDNHLVVATDSIRNTFNVFVKRHLGTETEPFGITLAEHFLNTYAHVSRAEVNLSEHCWDRIPVGGQPHAHAFAERGRAKLFSSIVLTRDARTIESGIEDLLVIKTTGSGFENFVRDEYATLAETSDRILATKLRAVWTYTQAPVSYAQTNAAILEVMLEEFAKNFSPSAQVTLFQMGEAALRVAPEISKISIAMPNKHHLLIDLAPFSLENNNEVFMPTDEPHGQIEGTISR
jgi:urate oxidase